jgi:hypothetical protein
MIQLLKTQRRKRLLAHYKELAITLSVLYALLLVSYFFIEVRPLKKVRITVKSLLAFLYLAFAALNVFLFFEGYLQILVMAALVFNAAGDILLVTSRKNMVRGACFFFVGALFLSAAMIISLTRTSVKLSSVLAGVLLGAAVIFAALMLQYKGVISFGKIAVITNAYIAGVTLMGSLALICLLSFDFSGTFMLAVGSLLFTLSDYLLILYIFKSKKSPLLVCNSASYFSGMWLIASSLAFLI